MNMKKYYKKEFKELMVHIRQKLLHTFISDFVKPGSVVIDLGANIGEFSKFIVDNFGSLVYALEPIPELFEVIPENPRIRKFQFCISKEKIVELLIPENQCATFYDKNFNKKIICKGITLEDFLKENKIHKIDLLKVDIEGAEIEMFENISYDVLENIDQITVEFHDFLWPELKFRVENIKRRLSENGFYCIPFTFFNNGDVLFIRRELISRCSYFYLKYFIKYVIGLGRIAAGQTGIKKFIFASSAGAVYGDVKKLPVKEEFPLNPLSPYALSKIVGEEFIKFYAKFYGFDYLILRYSNVFGLRQNPKGEAGVIAIFTELMKKNIRPTIFGDGTKTRDYVYIDDVVKANLLGIKNGKNEILNIASGKETADQKVFDTLAQMLNFKKLPVYAPFRKGEVYRIYADCSRAQKILGWKPKINFREGIKKYLNSL